MSERDTNIRIDQEDDVQLFLQQLRYAIKQKNTIFRYELKRRADLKRNRRFTNEYTLSVLFPSELEDVAIKRELLKLTTANYIHTVDYGSHYALKDNKVFGKSYDAGDVYIKLRVELFSKSVGGSDYILVMSFHFAKWAYRDLDFPYRKDVNHESNQA